MWKLKSRSQVFERNVCSINLFAFRLDPQNYPLSSCSSFSKSYPQCICFCFASIIFLSLSSPRALLHAHARARTYARTHARARAHTQTDHMSPFQEQMLHFLGALSYPAQFLGRRETSTLYVYVQTDAVDAVPSDAADVVPSAPVTTTCK